MKIIPFFKNLFITGILVLFSSIFIYSTSAKKNTFFAEIGVCTNFSNAGMLAQHGYTFIEESVGQFLVPDKSEEEFNVILEKAKKSPLPVKALNNFIPGSLKSVGPDAVHPEILEYMETAFRRAQKAGVEYIVFGSGGSRRIPDGFPRDEARNQFVSLCKSMAPIAAKYNVIVVLEPLNKKECNFINSVSEGGEIVKEVNHTNVQLLADIYHMLMDNESPESIVKYGDLIKHTHIAEKEDRAAPGTHNENFQPYFDALKKIGYQGKISVECRWKDLKLQTATAIESIRKQI